MAKPIKEKCIRCSKPSFARGCCYNHYHRAYRNIRAGVFRSWTQVEKEGLAISRKRKPGPKAKV